MLERLKTIKISETQNILLGFLAAIIVGTGLLSLPVASATGESQGILTALFTTTTSVCVTGLTVVDTFSSWSLFGKIVILLLIQLGGLGIVAFIFGTMLIFRRYVTLKNRMLLENAFNLSSLTGIPEFLRNVFLGTILVEFLGGLLCLPVFVRDFGAYGIFMSFFHSISAFCNAGIDIIGAESLVPYASDVWLNFVTILLIILGGIGFVVWFDVIHVIRKIRKEQASMRTFFTRLSLHSKITLTTTAFLLLFGFILFLIFEWSNPETLGPMNIGEKLLAAFFQSVTTRTAGFASIPQNELTSSSVMVSVVLMFIGGSSVGTAGGVKTSTIALLFLTAFSVVKGRSQITAFRRAIPKETVRRAIAVVLISLSTLLAAITLMTLLYDGDFLDIFFEITSALGTAGLTRGVSAAAPDMAKLLLVLCMYLGRVGPISLVLGLAMKSEDDAIIYTEKNITIG